MRTTMLFIGAQLFAIMPHLTSATLSVPTAAATPGGTISLPLSLSGSSGLFSALQWTLNYSGADVSRVEMLPGSASDAAAKVLNCVSSTGRYTCLISGLNQAAIGDGVVATAVLAFSPTTTAKSSAISFGGLSGSSAGGSAMNLGAAGSTVTIVQSANVSLAGLSCSPANLILPAAASCTVSLTAAAPSGGTLVTLGYAAAGLTVSMPPSVSVPAGATQAGFSAGLSASSSTTQVIISATLNANTLSFTLGTSPSAPVSVSVTPSKVTVPTGSTQRFVASVTGVNGNPAVTWTLSRNLGKIDKTGLYTPPAFVGGWQTVVVTATSVADPTKSASATVTLHR